MHLVGEVNDDMLNYVCYELEMAEKANVKQLTVHISSAGGNMDSGLSIAIRIRNSPIEITTYGLSDVSSSALMILAAGHKRVVSKYCRLLFHELSIGAPTEKISNMRKNIELYEKENNLMLKVLSDYAGIKISTLNKMIATHEDIILSAEQAVKLGFAQCMI